MTEKELIALGWHQWYHQDAWVNPKLGGGPILMCIPDVNKCANDLVSIGCEVEIDIPWTFDEVGLREILIEEWKLMVAKYEKEKESSNHAA